MNSTAFSLILVSAAIHAGWNLLLKKHTGNLFVLWVGLLIPGVLISSWGIASGEIGLESKGLEYLVASGIVHALYFYLLSICYSKGEISLVYPITRGTAVGAACIGAWFLFEENISTLGYLGIALVVLGVFAIQGTKANRSDFRLVSLSILAGAFSGLYSIIDKVGSQFISPLPYNGGFFLISALCLSPIVLKRHKLAEITGAFIPGLQIGFGIITCYILVLYAYSFGELSYIVPTREVSVLFGAILGWRFLNEKIGKAKVIGIAIILFGITLIKFT